MRLNRKIDSSINQPCLTFPQLQRKLFQNMIILNNLLYSCEQCIIRSEGQKCIHHQDHLFSVHQVKCFASPINNQAPTTKYNQLLAGKHRLMVKNPPNLAETIELSKHSDEEVLFSKVLCVDVTKSVGKIVFILESSTPVEVCFNKGYLNNGFVLPYGVSVNNDGVIASTSELIGVSSDEEIEEPVKIRPLSRKAMNNCGFLERINSKKISNLNGITTDNVSKDNKSLSPQIKDSKKETIPKSTNGTSTNKKLITPKKNRFEHLDKFLIETEQFIKEFCEETE